MSQAENYCCNSCESLSQKQSQKRVFKYWKPVTSLLLLLSGLAMEYFWATPWFSGYLQLSWYTIAYLPVGIPVLRQAYAHLIKGDVFTEFFLMGIATIGAFLIGEYPEAVAVMLFYSIGEAFQHSAADRARGHIKALLDVRPETAHVKRDGEITSTHPSGVRVGETIQVKPGERVPLDGKLISDTAAFDTSAITGESKPRSFQPGEKVLAGMVNLNQVTEFEVTATYDKSSITRILELVQNATLRKAKTELFIRSFARVYTPVVVGLAALLVILPALFVSPYHFQEWFYRGLVFLVISCPCALVISIPLGYFGGIGAASRNGILVKGSNYLDALKNVDTVVFDKTGTLTHGTFTVQNITSENGNQDEWLRSVHAMEKNSTHPIAKAIVQHLDDLNGNEPAVTDQTELPGFGIVATVNDKRVAVGNENLMEREAVAQTAKVPAKSGSVVHIAIDGAYQGHIHISDAVKADSSEAIKQLKQLGIERTIMLSGDKQHVAGELGSKLGIDETYAELLPEEKAAKLEKLKNQLQGTVAYVGDGINDAPVLALSDVGIAMGAMGSDVAIETADVVIQTDQPSKIATAIRIGKATRSIVWQNIVLALGVKGAVLTLGAVGLATMWGAVFADVGVALLAILNAVRVQHMKFE